MEAAIITVQIEYAQAHHVYVTFHILESRVSLCIM